MQIRKFRHKAGLTQREMAKKMNIAMDTISRYETGKRKPRASDLLAMAALFDCTVDELLKNEDSTEKPQCAALGAAIE